MLLRQHANAAMSALCVKHAGISAKERCVLMNNELTHEDIYKEFCEWSPDYAEMITDYKPWGHTSIVIWLRNGYTYKCKRHDKGVFTMQHVSESDIKRKFNL